MKKSLKRVLSVLLAAAMLLGMSVTSFAAGSSETGESQPILRGPAKPITSLTLKKDGWNKEDRCFEFRIIEQGIGPGTVKFNGTKISPYLTEHITVDGIEVIGWIMYYKSPKLNSVGTYELDASFVSAGTHKVWTLKNDFVVTREMLQ